MDKAGHILVLISLTMVSAVLLPRLSERLAGVEFFRVTEVSVEGNRYLSAEEIREAAGLRSDANVWDDRGPILEHLLAHPAIGSARIGRRLPSRLAIEVVEREPVALLPNPMLVPVDAEGTILPIDPVAHRLDLPLLHPRRDPAGKGPPLDALQLRMLVTELQRMAQVNPDVLASVSDVGLDLWGDVVMRMENGVVLQYRTPLSSRRLQEGLTVLADAIERNPGRRPAEIDLRFADQVVVRLAPSNGR